VVGVKFFPSVLADEKPPHVRLPTFPELRSAFIRARPLVRENGYGENREEPNNDDWTIPINAASDACSGLFLSTFCSASRVRIGSGVVLIAVDLTALPILLMLDLIVFSRR